MSNFYFMDGKRNINAIELFGRELKAGDYVFSCFFHKCTNSTGKLSFNAVPIYQLTETGFQCVRQDDGTTVDNVLPWSYIYDDLEKDVTGDMERATYVFKMDKAEAESILENAKVEDYCSDDSIKKKELFNRSVKAGDLVVYSKKNALYDTSAKYGIVVAENKVFNGVAVENLNYYCLVVNKDVQQTATQSHLQKHYTVYQLEKNKTEQKLKRGKEIGDVFEGDKYLYICIDKVKVGNKYKYYYLKELNFLGTEFDTLKKSGIDDKKVMDRLRDEGLSGAVTNVLASSVYVGNVEVNINDMARVKKYIDFVMARKSKYAEYKKSGRVQNLSYYWFKFDKEICSYAG